MRPDLLLALLVSTTTAASLHADSRQYLSQRRLDQTQQSGSRSRFALSRAEPGWSGWLSRRDRDGFVAMTTGMEDPFLGGNTDTESRVDNTMQKQRARHREEDELPTGSTRAANAPKSAGEEAPLDENGGLDSSTSQSDEGTETEKHHRHGERHTPQRTLVDTVLAADGSSVPIVSGVNGDPGVYPGSPNAYVDGWRVLPNVTGATIDTTTLKVGADGATLAHYITSSYDATSIKRAVIIVHGDNRDGWNEFIYGTASLQRAVQGGDVKANEVVLMAPQFFNDVDHGAYPADPLTNATTSDVMIWSDKLNNWGDGSSSIYPANSDVGAFDALDAALAFFHDRTRFPNMVNVVVAGFSMGGQLVQRYSVFRPMISADDESRTQYWVSSPASFVYFNDSRPEPVKKSCDGVNEYKYGLDGDLPDYLSSKGAGSPSNQGVSLDQAGLAPRYVSRKLNFLVGLKDHIAGDSRCQAMAQGRNHVTKLNNWITEVLPYVDASTNGKLPSNTTVDYVKNVAHQDYRIIPSDAGVQHLFLDDYSSLGSNAAAPPSNGDNSVAAPSTSDLGGDKEDGAIGSLTSPLVTSSRFFWAYVLLIVPLVAFLSS